MAGRDLPSNKVGPGKLRKNAKGGGTGAVGTIFVGGCIPSVCHVKALKLAVTLLKAGSGM